MAAYSFTPATAPDRFDLRRDNRTIDVDLHPGDLDDALRRARVPSGSPVTVLDHHGHQTTVTAR